MADLAGYSGKPLAVKLGIKPGIEPVVLLPREGYESLLGCPYRAELGPEERWVQAFVFTAEEVEAAFRSVMPRLVKNGELWISWPKRASKLSRGLGENDIRDIGLSEGMVDVKVIAVDLDWSGLKFVYRLKDR